MTRSASSHQEQVAAEKRVRMTDVIDQKIKDLLLFKKRLEDATIASSKFLPKNLFQKYQQLPQHYKVINDSEPFQDTENNDKIIEQFVSLLIHSIIITQQNNWILITQIEVYVKDKTVDDVAFVDKFDDYKHPLKIYFRKLQEGRGNWCELCISYGKILK